MLIIHFLNICLFICVLLFLNINYIIILIYNLIIIGIISKLFTPNK